MEKIVIIASAMCMFLGSCQSPTNPNVAEKVKKEIEATEKAFAEMAKKEGLARAFAFYAAENAVINYNDKLIIGRNNIKTHYSDPRYKGCSLEWAPDFVDAAASGDLGYTYGKYTFVRIDSTGNPQTFTGVFHTVWKKQADGTWRFVWD